MIAQKMLYKCFEAALKNCLEMLYTVPETVLISVNPVLSKCFQF